MDPEILQLILALANPKGQNTKADYSRLFDPMLGVLTGTYTAPSQPDTGDDDFLQYAPTFAQIGSEFVPENDIRRSIAASVMDGKPAMDIKKDVYEALKGDISSGVATEDTSKELASLVDTLTSEWRSYQTQVRKRASAPKDDFFTKAGLPSPEQAQIAAQEQADNVVMQLLGSYKPLAEPRRTAAVDDVVRRIEREKADAANEVQVRAMRIFPGSAPAYAKQREKYERRYADVPLRERAPENREAMQMLTRMQAQSGTLGQGAKKSVPDRSALVNRQREQRLAEIAPLVRDMALRDAQRSNPTLDALLQRALMVRLTGG